MTTKPRVQEHVWSQVPAFATPDIPRSPSKTNVISWAHERCETVCTPASSAAKIAPLNQDFIVSQAHPKLVPDTSLNPTKSNIIFPKSRQARKPSHLHSVASQDRPAVHTSGPFCFSVQDCTSPRSTRSGHNPCEAKVCRGIMKVIQD